MFGTLWYLYHMKGNTKPKRYELRVVTTDKVLFEKVVKMAEKESRPINKQTELLIQAGLKLLS